MLIRTYLNIYLYVFDHRAIRLNVHWFKLFHYYQKTILSTR